MDFYSLKLYLKVLQKVLPDTGLRGYRMRSAICLPLGARIGEDCKDVRACVNGEIQRRRIVHAHLQQSVAVIVHQVRYLRAIAGSEANFWFGLWRLCARSLTWLLFGLIETCIINQDIVFDFPEGDIEIRAVTI